MQKRAPVLKDIIISAVLAAVILYSATFAAGKALESSIYRKSKIVSMLVQQESIGISGAFENTRNIDLIIKFTKALATAYINFELIPVNEAETFVAVFESLPDAVDIENFEYQRKDLKITGVADSTWEYKNFLTGLKDRQRFLSVTERRHITADGKIYFELLLIA